MQWGLTLLKRAQKNYYFTYLKDNNIFLFLFYTKVETSGSFLPINKRKRVY